MESATRARRNVDWIVAPARADSPAIMQLGSQHAAKVQPNLHDRQR
jgi:hypothetical protein